MRNIKWHKFNGFLNFWLGIQYDFISDSFIIGLLFIYFRIPKEKIWRVRKRWKITYRIIALLMAVGIVFAVSGCPIETPPPAKHTAGKHKQQPAPNPDPANPPKGGQQIGNVSLTFWLEQTNKRTVATFNVGQGPVTHNCDDSCHWDAVAKPNQLVTVTVVYFTPGTKGHLKIEVVQNNNGRILCHDDNDDAGGNGGVDCQGVVVI